MATRRYMARRAQSTLALFVTRRCLQNGWESDRVFTEADAQLPINEKFFRIQCTLHRADLQDRCEPATTRNVEGRVDSIHLEICQWTCYGDGVPPTIILSSSVQKLSSSVIHRTAHAPISKREP